MGLASVFCCYYFPDDLAIINQITPAVFLHWQANQPALCRPNSRLFPTLSQISWRTHNRTDEQVHERQPEKRQVEPLTSLWRQLLAKFPEKTAESEYLASLPRKLQPEPPKALKTHNLNTVTAPMPMFST